MKLLSSIDDVIALLTQVSEIPPEQELERIEILEKHALSSANLNFPKDPFSPEYLESVKSLHRLLSGRVYCANEHEKTPMHVHERILKPAPFENDGNFLGNYLEAFGQIIQTMDVRPGSRVIEYGTGDGQIALFLARLGCDVTVVDIEQDYLDVVAGQAERLGCEINTVLGDFFSGDDLGLFDRVFFFQAFHHCLEHVAHLEHLYKIVDHNGFVVFAGEPIISPAGPWKLAVPYPWGPRLDGVSLRAIHVHGWMELGFQEPYFREALKRTGWSCEKKETSNGLATSFIARKIT